MRFARPAGTLALSLLVLLPGNATAQLRESGVARQTELTDPRDAAWFYRPERVEQERTEKLLDQLGIARGDVVADIGAGPGFFSLRAADRVGPDGRVLGVDVQPEMVAGLTRMAEQFEKSNIVPILGAVDDPKLPAGGIDHVLLVLAYHEFSHPAAMMRRIREAMRADGQLLVVEYRSEDPESRVDSLHEMSEAEILRDMRRFGFSRERVIDLVPSQHVFVFRKTEAPETSGNNARR
mgnify:CR=1 FL=1